MTNRKKPIETYTDAELDEAIDHASWRIPLFYVLLNGIDAYFERRKRRKYRANRAVDEACAEEFMRDQIWGNS